MNQKPRKRGEAYTGEGYGTLRFDLFNRSREHIIQSIRQGYYLEATSVIESVISDRLESRLSHLKKENFAFKTLWKLIHELRSMEEDPELKIIIEEIDDWRKKRNQAVHEMVKIQEGQKLSWEERVSLNEQIAITGYATLVKVYIRVGNLNPKHIDRVFRIEDMTQLSGVGDLSIMPFDEQYPNIAWWVQGGWIEIGQDETTASFIRVLDAGGLVWESETSHETVAAALAEADEAIGRLADEQGL